MTEQRPLLFTEQDKVQILLHEYDTLRQEVLNRTSNGFQLLAVGAALFVWMIGGQHPNNRFWFWIGLALALFAVSLAAWFIFRDISKAAKRIRELEGSINARAGEELLMWETRCGCDATGYIIGVKSVPATTTGNEAE